MKISKEVKIGIIALVTIAAFYWLFAYLQGNNLFTSGRVFYVKYHDVDGLLPTRPVNVNGLKVGRVDAIDIIEGQDSIYFVVKMVVTEDIDFTVNTVAEVYEPGLLAGKSIKLNLSYDGPLAKNGDTLVASSKASLMNMLTDKLAPTQNRLDSVLITLNTAIDNAGHMIDDETNQSLKSVLRRMDATVLALEATANSVTRTANSADVLITSSNRSIDAVSADTRRMMSSATTAIDKYGTVADKINQANIDQTLRNLEETSLSLRQTINRINDSNGSLNRFIEDPELYTNLNQTSDNLNRLVSDLQARPDRYLHFSVFGKRVANPEKVQVIEVVEP
ncbi:MAG: MlaD family protein [Weeksellaceae bacterium]|nr:MlaD family protein [Weeksellaceae bacterium]